MEQELQKASLWKRIAAGIFDLILIAILATGFGWLLSTVLHYDSYNDTLEAAYAQYESQYGVTFQITQEQYEAFDENQKQAYDDAYAALTADEEAMHAYTMAVNLMLLITTGAILLAMICICFIVPLLFGNGQTLGKKIFALCLMRTDGVKVNNLQLFTRAVLGQFAVETMIPAYVIFMIFWGTVDLFGLLLIAGLLIAQCIIMATTKTNSLLHDMMAGTVVVDFGSQRIFRTTEDLIAHKKQVAADRAARQTY